MSLVHHAYEAAATPERDPHFDAQHWRLQWFRHAGSVHRYRATDQLRLFYSASRPDKEPVRRELLDQLEAHAGNVAAVLAACDAESERYERRLFEEEVRA